MEVFFGSLLVFSVLAYHFSIREYNINIKRNVFSQSLNIDFKFRTQNISINFITRVKRRTFIF